MAAPNFVGPTPPPHRDTGEHEAAGPTAMDDRARAAHIAELAARLAAIESRDQASTSSPMRGSSSAVSKRSTGSTGSNRSSGPIGSSGTTGRRREPGGHPEDAPGDPAAVARSICLRLLTGAARPRAALETLEV